MTYYIKNTPNPSGAYPAPQSHYAANTIPLTDEQNALVRQYNGFVFITKNTDQTGASSYEVTANVEAWEEWKASLPPEPADPATDTEVLNTILGV